ncbi:MAG: hypothetical protein ACRDDE_12960 [Paraclostridium sp.]
MDIFKIFIPVMPQGESRNSKILEFLELKDRKNLMKNILQQKLTTV